MTRSSNGFVFSGFRKALLILNDLVASFSEKKFERRLSRGSRDLPELSAKELADTQKLAKPDKI